MHNWQHLLLLHDFSSLSAINFHSWFNEVHPGFESATEAINDFENVDRQRRRRSAAI